MNFKKILITIIKKQSFLILVVILCVSGYLAWQVSLISALVPDQATLNAERAKVKASTLKFDAQTIDMIVRQNQIEITPDTGNLGRANPFY